MVEQIQVFMPVYVKQMGVLGNGGAPMSEPRPGHQARMISVMIERVLAGESAVEVANDYGPWEWDALPDLKPVAAARARIAELEARLRALCDCLEAFEQATMENLPPETIEAIRDCAREARQSASRFVMGKPR